MPMINQPSNQIKLTNVSVVRLKKGKKRFELACYKNKLLEYREGTETDLDNILQIHKIFLNVSKGETAPHAELVKAWPPPTTTDEAATVGGAGANKGRGSKGSNKKSGKGKSHDDTNEHQQSYEDTIIEEILKKGEIQVNESERRELRERMEREIIDEVAQRLVDPSTKRVYTTGMIQKGLDLLLKEGGHAPQQDSLPHRLGKLNLTPSTTAHSDHSGIGTPTSTMAIKGSTTASGTLTPLSPAESSDAQQPDSKGGTTTTSTSSKKSDLPMWRGVDTTKPVKVQALDAIRALIAWQPIPVMRARMRLRITCPTSITKQPPRSITTDDTEEGKGTIKDRILSFVEQVESQDVLGEEWEVVGFVVPGAFKGLGEFCAAETKGRGKLEVLDTAVVHQDD